jgi:hypothetical protein
VLVILAREATLENFGELPALGVLSRLRDATTAGGGGGKGTKSTTTLIF